MAYISVTGTSGEIWILFSNSFVGHLTQEKEGNQNLFVSVEMFKVSYLGIQLKPAYPLPPGGHVF